MSESAKSIFRHNSIYHQGGEALTSKKAASSETAFEVERDTRFELATFTLAR